MSFSIQVGNPRSLSNPDLRDIDSVASLIESVFPMATEDAILCWNGVRVPLSYRYDLSCMVEDLVFMLDCILENPTDGEADVLWGSSSFRADWKLSWKAEEVTVFSNWYSVSGNVESALQESGSIVLPVSDFIGEWSGVIAALWDNIVEYEFAVSKPGLCFWEVMSSLKEELDEMGLVGRLYRG